MATPGQLDPPAVVVDSIRDRLDVKSRVHYLDEYRDAIAPLKGGPEDKGPPNLLVPATGPPAPGTTSPPRYSIADFKRDNEWFLIGECVEAWIADNVTGGTASRTDRFVPTAGQTSFILSFTPVADSVQMIINGQTYNQASKVDPGAVAVFTVLGTTVTWSDGPYTLDSSDEVVFTYRS